MAVGFGGIVTDRNTPLSIAGRRAAIADLLAWVQHDIVVTLRPELAEVGPQ